MIFEKQLRMNERFLTDYYKFEFLYLKLTSIGGTQDLDLHRRLRLDQKMYQTYDRVVLVTEYRNGLTSSQILSESINSFKARLDGSLEMSNKAFKDQ